MSDLYAISCPECGEKTYREFDHCHHCGWNLNEEPSDE